MNTMTIIWLVLAVVMAVVEGMTVQLVSIWFCIGAVAACITSLFTDSILIQGVVFVVVSAIALLVTRPLVKRLKRRGAEGSTTRTPRGLSRSITRSGRRVPLTDHPLKRA